MPIPNIHKSAEFGNVVMVSCALDSGVCVNSRDKDGCTPLMLAARYGRCQVIYMLLQNRPDLNLVNKGGLTSLHLAAANGHIDAVKLLKQAGASLDVVDNGGKTAIWWACVCGHPDLVEFLASEGDVQAFKHRFTDSHVFTESNASFYIPSLPSTPVSSQYSSVETLISDYNEHNTTHLDILSTSTEISTIKALDNFDLTKKERGLETIGQITWQENDLIGEGHEGICVFKGYFGNQDVAVKIISKRKMNTAKTERDIFLNMEPHVNVLKYLHWEEDDKLVCLALELCDCTLRDVIDGKLPSMEHLPTIADKKVDILRQITAGVRHLHSSNPTIVHRDLKPSNILLKTVGDRLIVKVSDFDHSKKMETGQHSMSVSMAGGTAGWRSKQMLEIIYNNTHITLTASTDIFSLGCIFYYVLTNGQHPFGKALGRDFLIEQGTKPNLKHLKKVPNFEFFKDLVSRMLCHNAELRPTAEEVYTFLVEQNHVESSLTDADTRDTSSPLEEAFRRTTQQMSRQNMTSETSRSRLIHSPKIEQTFSKTLHVDSGQAIAYSGESTQMQLQPTIIQQNIQVNITQNYQTEHLNVGHTPQVAIGATKISNIQAANNVVVQNLETANIEKSTNTAIGHTDKTDMNRSGNTGFGPGNTFNNYEGQPSMPELWSSEDSDSSVSSDSSQTE